MKRSFVDTSVLVRYFVDESDDHTERARKLIECVSIGDEEIQISTTVVFETIYVLTSFYKAPRSLVGNLILDLLGMSGVLLEEKADISTTIPFWIEETPLSFADCYHLVLTRSLGLTEIYTFDKKMDRYPGVTRIEP